MFQSNVPLEFWGECVLTAVYHINRIPTPLLSNKSSFEVLYNHPLSLAHLRVFGCECYATNVHPKQKFDPRASICVFMGYPHGQKRYFIPNLFSFLKIHYHIFLYLITFPLIHRFNRYPILIFLPIPCFPYLIIIPNHLHLPLMLLFGNPHPQKQSYHPHPHFILHCLLHLLPHLPRRQNPPIRHQFRPSMNLFSVVPLVIFNLLHGKKTTTCLPTLFILRCNQVLVKIQGIPFLLICLFFFVFLLITVPF